MNTYLLRQIIRQNGVRAVAAALGWHRKKVQELMRGKFEPDRTEIVKITKALHLSPNTFRDIFFPECMDERGRYWAV